jgi:hypothetical protein
MILAVWDADNTATVAAALVASLIGFGGVSFTLLLNGRRTERQRRRDLHARALAAITAYGEMPYRIRRRAPKPEERAALSDDLSRVKAEVDVCQVLLAADGDVKVANAFDRLYLTARGTAGTAANAAWKKGPIPAGADHLMNAGGTFKELESFRTEREQFADTLRRATLPRPQRAIRRLRVWIPGFEAPLTPEERRRQLPQDVEPSDQDTPTPGT